MLKHKAFAEVFEITILVLLVILGFAYNDDIENIINFGVSSPLGPIVLISVHIIHCIFFFIPVPFLAAIGGYVFGPILGFTYNLIGAMAGHCLLFFLAKKYGQKKLKNLFSKKKLQRFRDLLEKHEQFAILYSRLFPLAPGDVFTIFFGANGMKFKDFFILTLIGFIPRLAIESLLGSELRKGLLNWPAIILTIIMAIFLALYIEGKAIWNYLLKEENIFLFKVKNLFK